MRTWPAGIPGPRISSGICSAGSYGSILPCPDPVFPEEVAVVRREHHIGPAELAGALELRMIWSIAQVGRSRASSRCRATSAIPRHLLRCSAGQ